MSLRRQSLAVQAAFLAAFLAVWEAASRIGGVDPDVLPALSDVVSALWLLKSDPAFLRHAGSTITRVAVAFAIGAPLAILFGFFIGERVRLERSVTPALNFALAVPQSMLLPLFILLFGVGDLQKIVFGVTHIFFVLALTTVAAVQSVPNAYGVAARSFGATRWQTRVLVFLPAMLPLLVTGMRTAMIFNVVGILLAEMYASRSGLGLLIMQWGEAYQVRKLMAAVLLISLVTISFNELMRIWEARLGFGATARTSS